MSKDRGRKVAAARRDVGALSAAGSQVVKLGAWGSRRRTEGARSCLLPSDLLGLWSEAPSAQAGGPARARLGLSGRSLVRAIRTSRLHALPRFDLWPIDVVVDHGSRRDLVWRRVSRLDAVSGYPGRT